MHKQDVCCRSYLGLGTGNQTLLFARENEVGERRREEILGIVVARLSGARRTTRQFN
jgi:hypothetical protein